MVAQAISAVIRDRPANSALDFRDLFERCSTKRADHHLRSCAAFWIYCVLVVALILMAASAVLAQRTAARVAAPGAGASPANSYPTNPGPSQFPPGFSASSIRNPRRQLMTNISWAPPCIPRRVSTEPER